MMNTLIVKLYRKIIEQVRPLGALDTQVGGMPTLTFQGQPFCGLAFTNEMVFMLPPSDYAAAMKLKGAKPFAMKGGQSAKGWVLVPATHSARWPSFALAAIQALIEASKKS
jgi:hypothetical protein